MKNGAQKIMLFRPGFPKCIIDTNTKTKAIAKANHPLRLLSSMNTKNGNSI